MRGVSFPPFAIENDVGRGAVVLIVDHATNDIPPGYGTLGLDDAALASHIAWDPGALGVARAMAERLDAPLIRSTVSRLIIDPNRPLTSPTLIPTLSETTAIPGNAAMDAEDRAARIETVYRPYHAAIDALVARQCERCGGTVAVVAVHSFTPVFKGVTRALQIGILFDRDTRLGEAILADLAADAEVTAKANEPYSPADEVYWTLDAHAQSRGLPNVMIELRNDEIRTEATQRQWGEKLASAIARTMGTAGSDDRGGSARSATIR